MTTHKEKTQFVIDKIKTLVPEIMELKNGCRILAKDNTERFVLGKTASLPKFVITLHDEQLNATNIKYSKILGRPIQLHDILLACKRNGHVSTLVYDELSSVWDLSKNYNEQSKQDKIIEIIYKYLTDQ